MSRFFIREVDDYINTVQIGLFTVSKCFITFGANFNRLQPVWIVGNAEQRCACSQGLTRERGKHVLLT